MATYSLTRNFDMVTALTRALTIGVLLLPGLLLADKKVDDTVAKAIGQIDKDRENIDEPLKNAEKLAKDQTAEAQLGASRIYLRAGKLDLAAATAKKAVELSASAAPEVRAQALDQLAQLELRISNGKDALAHAQEAAKLAQTPDILATLARAQAKVKDPEAVDTADKLVKANPTSAAAYDALGRAQAAMGKYDEADAAFKKAVELDPKLYRAHLHRAQALVEAGKGTEAEVEARAATELDKNQPEGWSVLGQALLLKDPKNWQAAIVQAQQGAFLSPESPYTQAVVGQIFQAAGNAQQSAEAYKRALAVDPSNAKARVGLITAQVWRKEWDAATAEAAKLAEEQPNDGESQAIYGQLLIQKGDFASALEPLERAVKFLPGSAKAHALLAQGYERNHQNADAVREWEQAMKLEPGNRDWQLHYYERLANTMRASDPPKPQEAIAAYKKLLELDPKNATAQVGLGWSYYLAKDWQNAIAAFNAGAQAEPKLAGAAKYGIASATFQATVATKSKDTAAVRQAVDAAAAALPAGDPNIVKLKTSLERYEKAGEAVAVEHQQQPVEEHEKGPDLGALAQDLSSNSAATRAKAARQLGGLGAPAVEYLTPVLTRDNSLIVRTAAAKALGAIGGAAKSACPYLQQESDKSRNRVMLPAQGVTMKGDEMMAERELQEACMDASRKICGK
jgi:tetratricopeptide (TPR) repeat protein